MRGVVELPLYEYKCAKCGKRFEKIEKVSAPERQKCPKCGGRAERQIAAPAIQFKGSGWYVTDYGGKSSSEPKPSTEGSGDGSASKTAEKTSESKTDSKSDSKSESKTAASDNSNKGAAKRKK